MSILTRRLLVAGLMGSGVLGAVVLISLLYLRNHVGTLLEHYSRQKGIPLTVHQVTWLNRHALQLSDLQVGKQGEALRIKQVQLRWHWRGLLFEHRLDELVVDDPQVWSGHLSELLHGLEQGSTASSTSPRSPAKDSYVVGHVTVRRVTLNLDNLGPGLPALPVQLGYKQPVEFFNLPLGSSASLPADVPQTATVEHIVISSPFDPLTKVLEFETIILQFTWAGLARSQIDQLILKHPIIHLGPDLFWLTDQLKARSAAAGPGAIAAQPVPAWTVHLLTIDGGQLVISAFGDPGVLLPFSFASKAPEIRTDHLEDLSIRNEIAILPTPLNYPEYNISIIPTKGTLQFNLPPNKHDANNLAQTIYFQRVSWRDIEATNAWAFFYFDEKRIYGKFGGQVYGGYLDAQFSVNLTAGYPWRAWGYIANVQTGPILEKLTRDRLDLQLTGQASGKVSVDAHGTRINDTIADLHLRPPGRLRIGELDKITHNLPATWVGWKRETVLKMLSSFRTYDYTAADATAHYAYPHSTAGLELWGAQGHRKLRLRWDQQPNEAPLEFMGLAGAPDAGEAPEKAN